MNIRRDVIRLIFLTEKFQTAFLQGETLSPHEANLIRECATELFNAVPAPAEPDRDQFLIPF